MPSDANIDMHVARQQSAVALQRRCVWRTDGLSASHTRFQPKVGESEWPRVRLWHGILAENITQATAARVQRSIVRRLDAAGYAVVGHSHDEVLVEVSLEDTQAQKNIYAIVTERPPWAYGLILHSEGWSGQYYRK